MLRIWICTLRIGRGLTSYTYIFLTISCSALPTTRLIIVIAKLAARSFCTIITFVLYSKHATSKRRTNRVHALERGLLLITTTSFGLCQAETIPEEQQDSVGYVMGLIGT